jgi:uncharacterized integral membrane protein (TIGR00698 family)
MISPQWAFAAGIFLSFFLSYSPEIQQRAKAGGAKLLQFSVVLLGTSLHFRSVIEEGASGIFVTLISLILVFILGILGIKFLKLEKTLGLLLTMGTAICGGRAIAALAPVLGAETTIMSIAIAIVFILNAIAVFAFPYLGELFELGQSQFGIWAALAIHDTSSVVAASSLYGSEALAIATTVKLSRALWIIPITALFAILRKQKDNKASFPWFVLGFLGMSLLFTFVTPLKDFKEIFLIISKTGFTITLFLIGLTFDLKKMKRIGLRPFAFSVSLWIIVSIFTLIYVRLMI